MDTKRKMIVRAETLANTCSAGFNLLESVHRGFGLVEEITDMDVSFHKLTTYILHKLKVWLIEQHLKGVTRSVVIVMEQVSEEIEEMCCVGADDEWSFTEVGLMTMDFAYEIVEYLQENGWPNEDTDDARLMKVMERTIGKTFETFLS